MAYDIVQSVYLMNVAANGASAEKGTAASLQNLLAVSLNGGIDPLVPGNVEWPGFFKNMNPDLIGNDWGVVWGPAVYSIEPDSSAGKAANAMYVAYSASQKTYVVAIAATNPTSLYDWFDEDFKVEPAYTAPWPVTVPFVPEKHLPPLPLEHYVSEGTAIGISNLMQMTSNGQTLQAFLTGREALDDKQSLVVFTGHSLAGALSPTLAVTLYPTPATSNWNNVVVLATAGATPGSPGFYKVFQQGYPKTGVAGVDAAYGYWNVDHWNAADIVPHAWTLLHEAVDAAPDAQGNYRSLYGVVAPGIGKKLSLAMHNVFTDALPIFYSRISSVADFPAYRPVWGHYDWTHNTDGSFAYPPQWAALPAYTDAAPIRGLVELLTVFAAAHIDQYYQYFNVTPAPRLPKPKRERERELGAIDSVPV